MSFRELYDSVLCCEKCELCKSRTKVVFGEGNIHADVMFVGEAPGANEDRLGRPFVGNAGKLLDEMMGEIGLFRKDVFICNVLKCRPPKNRDPLPQEKEACLPFLRAQTAYIKPKIIVCLGRIAAAEILKRTVRMTSEHGEMMQKGNFWIMPTFHPASLCRGSYIAEAKEDFIKLKEKLRELECLTR